MGLEQRVVDLLEPASVFDDDDNLDLLTYAKFDVAITLFKKLHASRAFGYDMRLGDYTCVRYSSLVGSLCEGKR
jgi:hypothetical protein